MTLACVPWGWVARIVLVAIGSTLILLGVFRMGYNAGTWAGRRES